MHTLLRPHLVVGLSFASLASPLLTAQAATFPSDQPPKQLKGLPADRATGAAEINVAQLKVFLGKLAGEEFAGRGTGQEGFRKAAEYVRGHFKGLGLKPVFDGKYFQRVPWKRIAPNQESYSFALAKQVQVPLSKLGGSLYSSVNHQGPAQVVTLTDLDDPGLSDLKLDGHLAFLVVADPAKKRVSTRRLMRLRRAAKEAGASETIFVDDRFMAVQPKLVGPSFRARAGRINRGRQMRGTNLIALHAADFGLLLEQLGAPDLATLRKQKAPHKLGTPVTCRIETVTEDAPAFNVAAVLPGSDPKLSSEYVVIGSHLDHLGRRRGTIYYGADDDGSGSATVMALAQAFVKNDQRPRRSVLFVTFCGEENGLVGSRYFADNSPIPLSSIVTELQIDMVGRDEQKGSEKAEDNTNCLHLVGTKKLSGALHDLCLKLNERAEFGLEWDEEGVFYRSDHWSFARYGVPIAFFFTGFHPDYHRPSDTIEKINFDKMARIGRYIYDLGYQLAEQSERPKVDPDRWTKLRNKGRPQPVAPMNKR